MPEMFYQIYAYLFGTRKPESTDIHHECGASCTGWIYITGDLDTDTVVHGLENPMTGITVEYIDLAPVGGYEDWKEIKKRNARLRASSESTWNLCYELLADCSSVVSSEDESDELSLADSLVDDDDSNNANASSDSETNAEIERPALNRPDEGSGLGPYVPEMGTERRMYGRKIAKRRLY